MFFEGASGEVNFFKSRKSDSTVEVGIVVGLIASGDEDEAGSLVVVTRADDRAPHFWVSCKGVVEVYGDEEHKKKCEPPHCQQVARSLEISEPSRSKYYLTIV